MRYRFAVMLGLLPALIPNLAPGAMLTARHDLRAGAIIEAEDIVVDLSRDGDLDDPRRAVGRQLKRTIYGGQEISMLSLTAPQVVTRNQVVNLVFLHGGLTIETQGRALEPGSVGESIRVLNTASRATIRATVRQDGTVVVDGQP